MSRLMGYLAQFSSFFCQGEVLCTQGLTYLLQNPEASNVFGNYVSKQVGRTIPSNLNWIAEACQTDGGKCDLEGSVDGAPLLKIEAKLGAPFGAGQLHSYLEDLRSRCRSGGSLLVLVPRHRAAEIIQAVSSTLGLIELEPWTVGTSPSCSVRVIFWEDVLAELSSVNSEPFSSDLAQFHAMYRVLKGYDIVSPTSDADVLRWRETEESYVRLVDYVTRRLTREHRDQVLPVGTEGQRPNEFRRRYVCLPLGSEHPCFSIGTRDPFQGHRTPIWMRFNRTTPKFQVIEERLSKSDFSERLVESEGHIWIPLEVQLNVDGDQQVDSLVEQAEEIIGVAYKPLA